MKTVFKHECLSYFKSPRAYIAGAFLLLFAGLYCFYYNFYLSYTNFELVFNSMVFVFIIIVPVLTMQTVAEERKQKTDKLLYSLPYSMSQIILGKFLAMLFIFIVPVLIICLYPIVFLSPFGHVAFGQVYGTAVAFVLLGSSLLAMGMFVSSLSDSPAVAAGLSSIVVLANFFLADVADLLPSTKLSSYALSAFSLLVIGFAVMIVTKYSPESIVFTLLLQAVLALVYNFYGTHFYDLYAKILIRLSLFNKFSSFCEGIFDMTAVVYYISVIAFFLFLSVQTMERRRWS